MLNAITAEANDPIQPDRDDSRLFQVAIENMTQGLFMLDGNLDIIVINRQVLDIYGLPGDIIKVGANARDIVEQSVLVGNYPGHTFESAWAAASARLAGKKPWRIQQCLGNGKVVAIAYETMAFGGWVTTHLDVTDRQKAEDRLTYLAQYDALTGLANRTLALSNLGSHLASNHALGVLCLDLDRFKAVNDNLGHAAGDDLLRQVADRLRACVREGDTVARLGGDEFAVIQVQSGRPSNHGHLAARIIETIGAPFDLGGHRVEIGTSIGIAVAPDDGAIGEMLMKRADTALYRSKADGRGTFRYFEPAMDARLEQRRMLELDLHNAVARDEFELVYQPMVDLTTALVSGFEALLRWRHPVRGLVPPSDFIPIAEETGMIVPIGAWALRMACRQAAAWPANVCVALNLSAAQFRKGDIVASVKAALAESGLRANRLELEITESVLLRDGTSGLTALRALRALGVRIVLDDFGTGDSSLSYLRGFPFDQIKIDKSFVSDLPAQMDSRVIVDAIVGLGRSLGIRVLAEGVETPAQLASLRAAGCDSVQGYLFGLPVAHPDVTTTDSAIRAALSHPA